VCLLDPYSALSSLRPSRCLLLLPVGPPVQCICAHVFGVSGCYTARPLWLAAALVSYHIPPTPCHCHRHICLLRGIHLLLAYLKCRCCYALRRGSLRGAIPCACRWLPLAYPNLLARHHQRFGPVLEYGDKQLEGQDERHPQFRQTLATPCRSTPWRHPLRRPQRQRRGQSSRAAPAKTRRRSEGGSLRAWRKIVRGLLYGG